MTVPTSDAPKITTRGILLLTLCLSVVFGVYRAAVVYQSAPTFMVAVALLFAVQALIVDWLRRFLTQFPALWLLVPLVAAVLFCSLAAFAVMTVLRGL